ncbi:MAG: response regulator [Proteobacteria bacterium]|nr:response regulator [Pseudomonadota bacterium]
MESNPSQSLLHADPLRSSETDEVPIRGSNAPHRALARMGRQSPAAPSSQNRMPDGPALGVASSFPGRDWTGTARVLVIDDEPMVLRCLQRALRGHELVLALDGIAAFDRLEHDRRFDVILCDLAMPQMGGRKLHAMIKGRWPGLEQRMVFMTGGALPGDDRSFIGTIDNRRIDKPFDVSELRRQVMEIARDVGSYRPRNS